MRRWKWTLLDVILFLVALGVAVLLYKEEFSWPVASVQCGDPSLSRNSSLDDTVPTWSVVLVAMVGPPLLIIFVDFLPSLFQNGCRRCLPAFRCLLSLEFDLLIGATFAFIVTQILKISVSMPRPHFFQHCGAQICDDNVVFSISSDQCDNPHGLSESKLRDLFKSFPSAHACLGTYTAVYIILYFHARLPQKSRILRPVLQLIPFFWGLFCSVSRHWDSRHHWCDIIVGAAIGTAAALYVVKFLSRWFVDLSGNTSQKEDGSIHHQKLNGEGAALKLDNLGDGVI